MEEDLSSFFSFQTNNTSPSYSEMKKTKEIKIDYKKQTTSETRCNILRTLGISVSKRDNKKKTCKPWKTM